MYNKDIENINNNSNNITEFKLNNQQIQEKEFRNKLKKEAEANSVEINSLMNNTNDTLASTNQISINEDDSNKLKELRELEEQIKIEQRELSKLKEIVENDLEQKNLELNNNIRAFNLQVEQTKSDLETKAIELTSKESHLEENKKKLIEQEESIQKRNNIMYDTILNYCNKKNTNNITNIIIDSRTRDFGKYKTSDSYSIELNEPIENIKYIELINYNFTNIPYIINNTNNKFKLIEYKSVDNQLSNNNQSDNEKSDNEETQSEPSQITHEITIPIQDYTFQQLASEIERLINETSDNNYNISYLNNSYKISSENTFNLDFNDSCFNDIIGYNNTEYSNKNEYQSDKVPYVYPEQYVNLNISNIDIGKIFFKDQTYSYKEFEEPIRLNNLDINIFNYKNKMCDLQNSEHVFYLKVHCEAL